MVRKYEALECSGEIGDAQDSLDEAYGELSPDDDSGVDFYLYGYVHVYEYEEE